MCEAHLCWVPGGHWWMLSISRGWHRCGWLWRPVSQEWDAQLAKRSYWQRHPSNGSPKHPPANTWRQPRTPSHSLNDSQWFHFPHDEICHWLFQWRKVFNQRLLLWLDVLLLTSLRGKKQVNNANAIRLFLSFINRLGSPLFSEPLSTFVLCAWPLTFSYLASGTSETFLGYTTVSLSLGKSHQPNLINQVILNYSCAWNHAISGTGPLQCLCSD